MRMPAKSKANFWVFLCIYQAAIELVILIDVIIENLPRDRAYLADQFQRAGTSVPLNIAEGAGEYSIAEKARFYRMARRSATECAGVFDICRRLRLIQEVQYMKGRIRIVSMLTKMTQGASFVNVTVPVAMPDLSQIGRNLSSYTKNSIFGMI